MSNKTETSLSILLKFNSGLLNDSRAIKVRNRINTDPRWKKRWGRLREFDLDPEDTLSQTNSVEIDAQIVGEFIEQRLPYDAARELEKKAWHDPRLLREIIVAFRSVHMPPVHPQTPAPISESLSNRVLEMLSAATEIHERTEATDNGKLPFKTGSPTADQNSRKVLARHERSVEDLAPTRRRSYGWWLTAAAVLMATATVATIIAVSKPDSIDRQVREPVKEDNHLRDDNPFIVETEKETPDSEDSVSESADSESIDTPFFWQSSDFLAEDDESTNASREIPGIELEPDDSSRDRSIIGRTASGSTYEPLRPDWNEYHGVIALQEPGQSAIRGYGSPEVAGIATNIQVLPQSWAESDIGELGRLVIDSDSSIRIGQRSEVMDSIENPKRTEIILNYGRIAISGVAEGTRLMFKTGNASWPITVSKNDTTLGIEYAAGMARLFVKRGEASLRDMNLKNNDHVVWQRGQFSHPARATINYRWINRPDHTIRIPAQFKQQLFESGDLQQTLSQLQNSSDKTMRAAAINWQWTLQPAKVVNIFRSGDSKQWSSALNWLVDQPHGYPRTRFLWRSLAEMSGDTESTREFIRWTSFRARNLLPEPANLEKMITCLSNDHLFVRYVSSYYLEKSFGNPQGYRPSASPNVRNRIIRSWRRHIASVYHEMRHRRNKL